MAEAIIDNKARWEDLHSNPKFRPEWPNERVIQFINSVDVRPSDYVLDHGCGTGRHAIALSKMGFRNVIGCDVSKNGIDFAEAEASALKEYGRRPTFDLLESQDGVLPYVAAQFDAVISYGVLYYIPKHKIQFAIDELWRVLRPGGWLFAVVRSANDYRKDNRNIYRGEHERHMDMHFFTKGEVQEMFKRFGDVEIDEEAITYHGGKEYNHDYVITAKK